MPTYEFVCTECGNSVEVFQLVNEDPPSTCEVCGGALRKVFHPAGIVLKGSGFYKTDSRPGSGGKASPAKEQSPKATPADGKKPKEASTEKKKEQSA